MTPLTQQLEDKKKGCRYEYNYTGIFCGDIVLDECNVEEKAYCNKCQAEIAILEQAIAEMQKRDKDIDELAESSTFALCALMKENKELKNLIQEKKEADEKEKREELEAERDTDLVEILKIIQDWVHAYECIYGDTNQETYLQEKAQAIDKINRLKEKQLNQPKTERGEK